MLPMVGLPKMTASPGRPLQDRCGSRYVKQILWTGTKDVLLFFLLPNSISEIYMFRAMNNLLQ